MKNEYLLDVAQNGINQEALGREFVARLGEVVGDCRKLGEAGGLRESEIKEVFTTTFRILLKNEAQNGRIRAIKIIS